MARFIQISALTLIGAGWLAMAGCSGSNDPAQTTTTGGTTSSSTGGTTATTGGTTSTTGGTSASTGGTTATTGGTTATTGGTTATTGGAATGTDMFTPLCGTLTTEAGPAPTKGGVCTTSDPALCYKTCGPQSVGFKSETCTSGAYVEQSGCSFKADLDASCYKIPATLDASCPATAPKAGEVCTVAVCTPCSDPTGTYLDSSGAPKVGWCVCPAPGASGMSKWSCASATAWPCPQGKGC
jgi:hypothetical protein